MSFKLQKIKIKRLSYIESLALRSFDEAKTFYINFEIKKNLNFNLFYSIFILLKIKHFSRASSGKPFLEPTLGVIGIETPYNPL